MIEARPPLGVAGFFSTEDFRTSKKTREPLLGEGVGIDAAWSSTPFQNG